MGTHAAAPSHDPVDPRLGRDSHCYVYVHLGPYEDVAAGYCCDAYFMFTPIIARGLCMLRCPTTGSRLLPGVKYCSIRYQDNRRWMRHTYTYIFFSHFYFPASGQAVVTGVVPSSPRFLHSIFIAHRVQQSHCSSIFHRVLLTHALALYASRFVHKKKSQRIYTTMHSAGLEPTKLTYTRLEDNLIRHRGDRGI